jgi:hypothetical protein
MSRRASRRWETFCVCPEDGGVEVGGEATCLVPHRVGLAAERLKIGPLHCVKIAGGGLVLARLSEASSLEGISGDVAGAPPDCLWCFGPDICVGPMTLFRLRRCWRLVGPVRRGRNCEGLSFEL